MQLTDSIVGTRNTKQTQILLRRPMILPEDMEMQAMQNNNNNLLPAKITTLGERMPQLPLHGAGVHQGVKWILKTK